jgi:hypothetical protein
MGGYQRAKLLLLGAAVAFGGLELVKMLQTKVDELRKSH